MDLSLAIKTAYFQALNGNIGCPVYDAFSIPPTVTYPYVIIASIDVREIFEAGCKMWRADVLLDVVTGFSSPTGMNAAWNIADLIEAEINPDSRDNIDLTSSGYTCIMTRLASSTNVQLRTENYWIYRTLRTYSHIVC